MSENPIDASPMREFLQADFERITPLVTAEFQVEEALLEQGTPTYYLKWPQETKQPFLRLLKNLEEMKLIAFLRKPEKRVVLKVTWKPPVKRSNPTIYWGLFLATVTTTFFTGYIGFQAGGMNPYVSGAIFSAAILTVLGLHEMGHKLTANRNKVEATSPYFIPGLPPLGTFGAVIVQKSLPPNRDALFDIGANGPMAGFVVALVFSAVGLTLLTPTVIPPGETGLSLIPVSWMLLQPLLISFNLIPPLNPPNNAWALHPVTWAGWAGMVVTMLNLLPAAMLDGGHVARSVVPDRLRYVLTIVSVAVLLLAGSEFWVMAFLIVFMSAFRHPGPLDDVSSLSRGKKLTIVALLAVFALSFPLRT